MIENKRFTIEEDKIKDNQSPYCYIEYYKGLIPIVDLLNELAEENQLLKEKEKDMLDYLKQEYNYAYKQRMKHLDDAVLTSCYEMIEYHIRSMIEHLEGL